MLIEHYTADKAASAWRIWHTIQRE